MRLFGPMIMLIMIEIALFISLGGAIGLLASLGIILGSGILGLVTLRQTSASVVQNLRTTMANASLTSRALPQIAGDHSFRILAGILLILPGFLGDMVGAILLIGPLRRWLAKKVASRMKAAQPFGVHPERNVVIDGEFIELDPSETPPRSSSGWTRH